MDNLGPQLAAVVILFLILTWLTVGLRCMVRARMIKSFGLDDWTMVLSLVSYQLFCLRRPRPAIKPPAKKNSR